MFLVAVAAAAAAVATPPCELVAPVVHALCIVYATCTYRDG